MPQQPQQQQRATLQMGTVAPQLLRAPGNMSLQVRQRLQSHVAGHQQFATVSQQSVLPSVHNMFATQQQQQQQHQQQQQVVMADNLANAMLIEQQGSTYVLTDPNGVLNEYSTTYASIDNTSGGGSAAQFPAGSITLLDELGEQSQMQAGQQFEQQFATLPSENLLVTGSGVGSSQQLQLIATHTGADGMQYFDTSQLNLGSSLALSPNSLESTLASLNSTATNMPTGLDDIQNCKYSYSTCPPILYTLQSTCTLLHCTYNILQLFYYSY